MAARGGKRRADTEAMRAKAAELYANGARLGEVARALGVTERRARSLKAAVSSDIKAAATATIEGIVEAGHRARAVAADNGERLMGVLVDGALGRLEHGDESREADPIERDPQMVNARTKAAGMALGFILAQRADLHVTGAASLVAQITALARSREDEP